MMHNGYSNYVPVFKALADETRLQIIDMLSCGEMCACEILERFDIAQSTLSYHMKILTSSRLVNVRREGSMMRYTLADDIIQDTLFFLTLITSDKEDCICHTASNKTCHC